MWFPLAQVMLVGCRAEARGDVWGSQKHLLCRSFSKELCPTCASTLISQIPFSFSSARPPGFAPISSPHMVVWKLLQAVIWGHFGAHFVSLFSRVSGLDHPLFNVWNSCFVHFFYILTPGGGIPVVQMLYLFDECEFQTNSYPKNRW